MLRKEPLATGYVYHIFNRGVNKGDIFFDERDYKRFIMVAGYYLSNEKPFSHFFQLEESNSVSEKKISVLAYCLMPNHFHFLIKQLVDGGITWYMQHLANSYSHHIHKKYNRVGPLFESRYKNVLVGTDEQLVHVLRYIHLNPLVSGLVSDLKNYKYSSYLSYIDGSKDDLCNTELGLSYFRSRRNFENFVLDQADYGRILEKMKHLAVDLE